MKRWGGFGLVVVVALTAVSAGCMFPEVGKRVLYRPVNVTAPEIMVDPGMGVLHGKLAVPLFTVPRYAEVAGNVIAASYCREMMKTGLFSGVNFLENTLQENSAPSGMKNYDFVLLGRVQYILAGSGDTPSQLTIEVQIYDTAGQRVVCDVRQSASSLPSEPADIVWYTVGQERAMPYQALSEALAKHFANVLTLSDPKRKAARADFKTGTNSPEDPFTSRF